jgi:hypothetical protein
MPHGAGLQKLSFALPKKEIKMDFSKFDASKLFDVSAAIDSFEKGADSMLTYVPEQFKKPVTEMTKASFELARAQHEAFTKFGSVVQKQIKAVA